MSLLPRKFAYGAQLPGDPMQQALQKRQKQQAMGSQVSGTLSSVASAAGPVGQMVSTGLQMTDQVSNLVDGMAKDEDGLYKNDSFGTRAAASVANAINPIKAFSTLAGVISGKRKWNDPYGIKKDQELREQMNQDKMRQGIATAQSAGQQAYASLLRAKGGLLPRHFAGGGRTPARPAPANPANKDVLARRTLEEQSADQQKDWTVNYINSPMYQKRLIREQTGGEDRMDRDNRLQAFQTQQQRAERVKTGNTHFVDQIAYKPQVYLGLNTLDPNVVKEDATFASIKDLPVKANDVVLERNLPERYSTSPAHEFSHQSTMATKGMSDFARLGISQRVAPGTSSYLSKPTEIKARMDAVRYQLEQQGLYNAGSQEFTQDVLDKARQNEAVKGNQNFIELEQILKGKNGTADENLLWMFNNVASTQPARGAQANRLMQLAARGGRLLPGRRFEKGGKHADCGCGCNSCGGEGKKEKKGAPAEKPRSVIAHGALHNERNNLRHKTAGKRGIPVLAADGTKLAEVERDELTLHKGITDQIEALRQEHHENGGKPATLRRLGRLLAQEITTNTTPSPRYAKRLAK